MTKKTLKATKKVSVINSEDYIHEQMDSNPHYPFNVQSGWLPMPSSPSMNIFFKEVLGAAPKEYAPCIKALDQLITNSEVLTYLIDNACRENSNIIASKFKAAKSLNLPRIASKDDLLNAFNHLLDQSPKFINN